VSLIGGVSQRIPQDMDVEVAGFRPFGRVRVEPAARSGLAATVLKVREYSLVGGVHVGRAR
jgi:hypothetical protein